MVLIIRNNRIQSRRHSKFKKFFTDFYPQSRHNYEDTQVVEARPQASNMTLTMVLSKLFLFSAAMFTLPFVAYFGTQYVMFDKFHFDHFTSVCFATFASVLMVNVIIAGYAYQAYREIKQDEASEAREHQD